MLSTALNYVPNYATVDRFALLRGQLLSGDRLAQVKALQASIARFGLLSPIIAVERAGRLVVVDGRKRLAAIRRLAFEGRLPLALKRIPFIHAKAMSPAERRAPLMISSPDLFRAIRENFQSGSTLDEIASEFQISRQCVRDVLSLSRLHAIIRTAVFKRRINFAQARAYATLPSRAKQRLLFEHIGHKASAETIMSYSQKLASVEETASADRVQGLVAA